MPIPCDRKQLERDSHFESPDGKPAVRVGGTGSIIEGLIFDAITGEETSTTVETYRYYQGGTGGTLIATVVVTYSDNTKCFVTSAVRS